MECRHNEVYEGLCIDCGKDVHQHGDDHGRIHITKGLSVSKELARDLSEEATRHLLESRKLTLVLDIDNTLLHATTLYNHETVCLHEDLLPDFSFTLGTGENHFFIKKRPGLESFLKKTSQYFELHLYTMGSAEYAHQIAASLDPQGIYFRQRITSREDIAGELLDDSDTATDKDYESFPVSGMRKKIFPLLGDKRMVLIIDDRTDVWATAPDNLIKITPFNYFSGFNDLIMRSDIDALLTLMKKKRLKKHFKKHLLLSEKDEGNKNKNNSSMLNTMLLELTDEELTILSGVLLELHSKYFSWYDREFETDVDIRVLLTQKKKKVFDKCCVCFTGCIPTNSRPEIHSLWKTVLQFGGQCHHSLSPTTTHLVASSRTKKVIRAMKEFHVKIVKPQWVLDSALHWKRQIEAEYKVKSLPLETQGVFPSQEKVERTPSKKMKMKQDTFDTPENTGVHIKEGHSDNLEDMANDIESFFL